MSLFFISKNTCNSFNIGIYLSCNQKEQIIKFERKGKKMKASFKEFCFGDLNVRDKSNKYLTMDRVNKDETKIVVKIDGGHLIPTKYGYALILDDKHVVFLKDWQVNSNWYGNEVLLNKEYWNVKEWGDFPDYMDNEQNLNFDEWLKVAKEQQEAGNVVSWEK